MVLYNNISMASNGFIRKKVSSMTLGEKLKKLRGEGRISLAEISKQTKVQVKYLELLESGEYAKLPADVYVKGFLRSYAHYLGVDENYLIKLYEREKGIQKNIKQEAKKDDQFSVMKFPSFSITPRKIIISAVSLLVLGGFLYIYNELDRFISTPRLVLAAPADGLVTEEKSVYVSGETEKGAEVFINGQPTLVNDTGGFNEKVGLQEGLNTISVAAKNRFNKESIRNITVRANYPVPENNSVSADAEKKDEPANLDSGIKMEIYVQPDPTWISVETDGNLVYSGTLLPQAVQSFQAKEKISITSGRGNNTFIRLNGEDKGMLSNDSGVVRNVVFTTGTKY